MVSGAVTVSGAEISGFKGAWFDGVDDKITITNSSIDLRTNFSIFTRFIARYPTVSLSSVYRTNTDSYGMVLSGDTFNVSIKDDDSLKSEGNINIDYDNPMTLCQVMKENEFDIYVNGTFSETVVLSGAAIAAASLFLGFEGGSSRFFNGVIDTLSIYNKPLGAAEITKLHLNQDVTDDLIHKWDFKDGTYNDSVGSANGVNAGSSIKIFEVNTRNFLSGARLSANDKYLIWDGLGNKINSLVMNEA